MAAADRYLLTGAGAHRIYPGTTADLINAIAMAKALSAKVPGQHRLIADHGGTRLAFQVYEDGRCTWVRNRADG